MYVAFELQKLFQFNKFFKLRRLSTDYSDKIYNRTNSVSNSLAKIAFADLLYVILIFIGLFTINCYFFAGIILLSFSQHIIFKKIKNRTFKKISFGMDIILSLSFLCLILMNNYIYKLYEIDLIKQLFNI